MLRAIVGTGTEGAAYYAKPLPIIETPWTVDILVATEAGATGIFFADVAGNRDYAVYEQVGESPSPMDDYEGTLLSSLRAIQTSTERMGTGTATVAAPVTATGRLHPIIQGDDYLVANSRAFIWTVDPVPGFALETVVCWFGAVSCTTPSQNWRVSGAVSQTIDGRWRLTFELSKSVTAGLDVGPYDWSVALTDNQIEITQVKSKEGHRVELVPKQA